MPSIAFHQTFSHRPRDLLRRTALLVGASMMWSSMSVMFET
jgi:hypothetical protein